MILNLIFHPIVSPKEYFECFQSYSHHSCIGHFCKIVVIPGSTWQQIFEQEYPDGWFNVSNIRMFAVAFQMRYNQLKLQTRLGNI